MQRSATDGRAARRLAASLGPTAVPGLTGDEEPIRQPGGSAGLLDAGTGGGFAYGRQTGAPGSGMSRVVAEPRFRWRLGIRAAVLVGVLSLIAAALLWWQVAANGPVVLPLSSVSHGAAGKPAASTHDQESSSPDSGGTESSGPDGNGNDTDGTNTDGTSSHGTAAGNVVVHVAGAVKKAGVVRLPRGSRVHEAIAAAGGASPEADLDRLNLASLLEDGQKIYVTRRGEAAPGKAAPADKSAPAGTSGAGAAETEGTGGPAGEGSGGKINLNTATAEELAALPKVGPVLAQRIVDWRTQQGPFKSPEELDAVDGVGPKMLETLLPLVTV
ncbi:ComEA family DNA-binding protein [Arthrobacter globiformis]|uniref:ComEA family DNA-binding protein n=1 Tax=Arthrobacter globiformis TaxID=1665 RepID=UPI0027857A0F|nr:ComEA family DNA-binding protein [Arthrobacter globiformis]MDQ0865467.1 competence protein ComEA [Arthrobacter globiformis]